MLLFKSMNFKIFYIFATKQEIIKYMLRSSSKVLQLKTLLTNLANPDWKWRLSVEGKTKDATVISVVLCPTCIIFKDTVCVDMASKD